MGTIFDPKSAFLGMPLTTYRDVLRRWMTYHDVREVVGTQKLALSPQAAAVLINEADLAGFFKGDELTDVGRGFAGASSLRPMKREKAKAIIEQIISNCEKFNRRDDLCFRIERVWLFGSYIKGASTVNDIDIVIEEGRIPGRSLLDAAWRDRTTDLACEMGGERAVYGSVGYAVNAERHIFNQLIYGGHKNPRISPNYLHTLIEMACECQLVFDRSRGGPVQDSVLAKHPDATQRSDNIHAKAVMPELHPAPATTPVRIDLATVRDYHSNFASLFDVNLYRIETDADEVSDEMFALWLFSLGKLDGREKSFVAYIVDDRPDRLPPRGPRAPAFAAALARTITFDGETFSYRLSVCDAYLGGRQSFSPEAAASIAGKILLAIGSDIEAISMKCSDPSLRISIEVNAEGDTPDQLRQLIQNELQSEIAWSVDSKAQWLSREVRERMAASTLQAEISCPELPRSRFRPD